MAFTSTAIDRLKPNARHALQHEMVVACTLSYGQYAGASNTSNRQTRAAEDLSPLSCQHLRNSCRVGMWLPSTPPRWNALSCAAVSCCIVAVSNLSPSAWQHAGAWQDVVTVCKDVWEVKDAAVGPPTALSYLLAALQLQQRSAGNLLAPRAGACCHETRLADRPLFPVEHTSVINVTAWQAEI